MAGGFIIDSNKASIISSFHSGKATVTQSKVQPRSDCTRNQTPSPTPPEGRGRAKRLRRPGYTPGTAFLAKYH